MIEANKSRSTDKPNATENTNVVNSTMISMWMIEKYWAGKTKLEKH